VCPGDVVSGDVDVVIVVVRVIGTWDDVAGAVVAAAVVPQLVVVVGGLVVMTAEPDVSASGPVVVT
jgi:hypothetical protein